MTFASLTTSTRRAKPSHEPWQAHAYQRRASEFLRGQGAAALFLDPGLGKTSIVLDAFNRLKQAGIARKMLVVAPLRVCQTVWRQEAQKWTEFRDLRISLLHGDKKADRLKDDADVWLINPEGVKWLRDKMLGHAFPFDTVVLDELTKFKNHSADRSKFIRALIKHAPRRWGLTGSPAPNGYMDLFGQMLALDDGAALGKYITHYRDQYFQVDYDGFTYDLQPGAAKRIEDRLRPYVLRMSAEEYLELPPLVDDVRELEMEPAARKTYSTMKKDMLAELPEGVVTGANAAAVYSKLKQMANGAVYVNDAHDVAQIHNTKLEALDELIEELAGQQLLIGYEFQHDLDRLKAHLGDRLHNIGSGAGEKRTAETVNSWNAGAIRLLACHPASAAHGLNLQYGGCSHVCWMAPIWDLELYQQFIRRIYRQGTTSQRVVNHLLCVKDTIDEFALAALRDKDTTQSRFLRGLNTEILRDAETQAGGVPVETRTVQMTVAKLSRQSDAGGGEPRKIIPRGWGKAAEAANEDRPAPADDTAQRQRIQAKLTGADTQDADEGPSMADKARAAFSPAVRQHMAQMEGDALSETQYVDKDGTIREKAAAAEPTRSTFGKRGQLDIEDVAPASQRAVQSETQEAETPARASRKRAPTASVGPTAGDSPELRLSLMAIAGGDVMKARQMLEFVTGA